MERAGWDVAGDRRDPLGSGGLLRSHLRRPAAVDSPRGPGHRACNGSYTFLRKPASSGSSAGAGSRASGGQAVELRPRVQSAYHAEY